MKKLNQFDKSQLAALKHREKEIQRLITEGDVAESAAANTVAPETPVDRLIRLLESL